MANFSAKTAVVLPSLDLFSGFSKISPSSVTKLLTGFRIQLSATETVEVMGAFTYSAVNTNVPIGGTVNGIALAVSGAVVYQLDGISVAWATAMAYAASQPAALGAWSTLMGGADVVAGSAFADTLIGHGGKDSINGGGGLDTMLYTEKTQSVVATLNDAAPVTVTVGGTDEDTLLSIENLTGGSAGDTLTGDTGANILIGGAGNDILQGRGGADVIDGGLDVDTVVFTEKLLSVVLALNGATDAKATVGGVVEDIVRNVENIKGGLGGDILTGDALVNVIEGGGGADILAGLAGKDVLDGGAGLDTAVYSDKLLAVQVILNGGTETVVKVGGIDEDAIRSIENITGGSGDDTLTGDDLANVLDGGLGADTLKGGGESDVLDGGGGVDTALYTDETASVVVTLTGAINAAVVIDGKAADTLRNIENLTGGTGNDSFTGDSLANSFDGGSGNDTLKGGGGDDTLFGRAGVDTLDGGSGFDTASYAEKTVTVTVVLNGDVDTKVKIGDATEDTIRSIENITGGLGNDLLTGDGLANVFLGGGGADVLAGLGGKDVLDGGVGIDTASYAEKTLGVKVTLASGNDAVVYVGGLAEDTIRSIENVAGGSGADDFTGDATANGFDGGGGNDRFAGLGGKDVIDGGGGSDTASYAERVQPVVVALTGGVAATVTVNGQDEDTLQNVENVIGGSGADTLTGDSADNTLEGRDGEDLLQGGAGLDFLDGGTGIDTASFADTAASVVLTLNSVVSAVATVDGKAEDTLRNIENVIGGGGADTLTGDSLANTLSGGGGADKLTGGLGDDRLEGGAGADTIDGGGGVDTASYTDKTLSVVVTLAGPTATTVKVGGVDEDTLRNVENVVGGDGADTLTGDTLANFLDGRLGVDTLAGGLGDDQLRGGGGADIIDGGGGIADTVLFTDKVLGVALTLAGNLPAIAVVGGAAEDSVVNVENIVGGSGGDTLTGDANANAIDGGAGDDVLAGGAGIDTLDGGLGVDTASYAEKTVSVAVTLNRSISVTVLVNGAAEDSIRFIENVVGGSADDVLTGDSLANGLSGGGGNDTLQGMFGDDVLDGGLGEDTVVYSDKLAAVELELSDTQFATAFNGGFAEDQVRNVENIIGGGGADVLGGNNAANRIEGRGANDVIAGRGGADKLDGGLGNDTVSYSEKTDSVVLTLNGALTALATVKGVLEDEVMNFENITGGGGADILTGDAQTNILSGGGGADTLNGAGGDDVLIGGEGADTLEGDAGTSDTASYREKTVSVTVTLNGDNQADVLVGGTKEDKVRNIENIEGGTAADTLTGDNLGNAFLGGGGKDVLDGAGGLDTALYTDKTLAVSVTLNEGTFVNASVGGAIEDTLRFIENVTGGAGDDILVGDGLANVLSGGVGADLLQGRGGNDTLDGGDGLDTAVYTDKTLAVVLTLAGAAPSTATVGGLAEDFVRNIENVTGGAAGDTLVGDAAANVLDGGGGADKLTGNAGKDSLDGGTGIDTAYYLEKTVAVSVALNNNLPATVFVAGVAEDTLRNIENVSGGTADDTLAGDNQANLLDGQAGDDRLTGGGGFDVLEGGGGVDTAVFADKVLAVSVVLNGAIESVASVGGFAEDTLRDIENVVGGGAADTLTGDAQDNMLDGGANADVLSGMDGADLLIGGAGADKINGGDGFDTASYAEKIVSVVVTLNGPTATVVKVAGFDEDTLVNVENVIGGFAADTLTGDALANRFTGGGGKDAIDGMAGNDTADYSDKTLAVVATLAGANFSTVTVGGLAEDTLRSIENLVGGSNNDTLTGDTWANILWGGAGNDVLNGWLGADIIDGGAGSDTASYTGRGAAVSVTLAGVLDAPVLMNGVAEDILRGIENVTGGMANDLLVGDAQVNILDGGIGDDQLRGLGGADVLDGGTGSDTALYDELTLNMSLTLAGAANAVVTIAGFLQDTLRNVENIVAGAGNDTVTGDTQANSITGGAGKDTLDGAGGIDTVLYTDKAQAVVVSLSAETFATVTVGGIIEDTIRNFENVVGGAGNDVLTGDALDNALSGGDGDDTLAGGAGNDVLRGGIGSDVAVFAGKLADYGIVFGVGTTTVKGADGTDTVSEIETLRFADGDVPVVAGSALSIGPNATSKPEGHGGATPYSFTVTRAGNTSKAQSVAWSVAGEDAPGLAAASAADFVGGALPGGTLTFAVGETLKTVTVQVQGDLAGETNERFVVTLSGAPVGASIVAGTAVGVILNDDVSLSLAAVKAVQAEGAGGATTPFTFQINRAGVASGTTDVNWAVVPGTASASDFAGGVLPQGKVTFAAGQTVANVTVAVAGDAAAEADEDFSVVIYGATGGATIAAMLATGTILTDDAIAGTVGNDPLLMGTMGNDIFSLIGGVDTVLGLGGVDRFLFAPGAVGTAATKTVTLTDFDRSLLEVIDLSAIDAKAGTVANDAFSFIDTAGFGGVAGQLRWSDLGTELLIQGDVNGDAVADLTIRTPMMGTVSADWFVL